MFLSTAFLLLFASANAQYLVNYHQNPDNVPPGNGAVFVNFLGIPQQRQQQQPQQQTVYRRQPIQRQPEPQRQTQPQQFPFAYMAGYPYFIPAFSYPADNRYRAAAPAPAQNAAPSPAPLVSIPRIPPVPQPPPTESSTPRYTRTYRTSTSASPVQQQEHIHRIVFETPSTQAPTPETTTPIPQEVIHRVLFQYPQRQPDMEVVPRQTTPAPVVQTKPAPTVQMTRPAPVVEPIPQVHRTNVVIQVEGQQREYPAQQGYYPAQSQQSGYPAQSQQSGYPAQSQQSGYPAQSQQSGYPVQQSYYPGQIQQSGYPVQQSYYPQPNGYQGSYQSSSQGGYQTQEQQPLLTAYGNGVDTISVPVRENEYPDMVYVQGQIEPLEGITNPGRTNPTGPTWVFIDGEIYGM